jgi:hypothetical protein
LGGHRPDSGIFATLFPAIFLMKSPLRFVGLATQWAVMLGAAVWGGLWLDERIGVKALGVIVLPVAALAISLLQLIRELGRKNGPPKKS